MKKLLSKMAARLAHRFALLFYDDKYLCGKWFPKDHYGLGWQKCIHFWYHQKIRKINGHVPWPVPTSMMIGDPNNIEFNCDDIANFWSVGCYFQAIGAKIRIGKGTIIAPGVGVITSNHDVFNLAEHAEGKDVVIGENCWIGMNAVILPGVVLGDRTIVGAGAVVTKSFPQGNCIIVGNPARLLRNL